MFPPSILFVHSPLLRYPKFQNRFVTSRYIRRHQSRFYNHGIRLAAAPEQHPQAEQKFDEHEHLKSSAGRSPDELFSSFDATIDDLEQDLERSIGGDRGGPSGSSRRRQEHQQRSEQAQRDHIRRLEILTSLPAELSVEHVPDRCLGCGTILQSASPKRPGYLPRQIMELKGNASNMKMGGNYLTNSDDTVCQRCFRLTHYGSIDPELRVFTKRAIVAAGRVKNNVFSERPNNELSPGKFRRCLEQLQTVKAVIVYLVDIFDFSGSFIPALRDIIGARNPVILAVNKVDLLPSDYSPSRVISWVQQECRALRLYNVNGVHLISSVRGTGVSDLLADAVQLARKSRADIYIVGAANVGKSSFINQVMRRRKTIGKPVQIAQMSVAEPTSSDEGDFRGHEKTVHGIINKNITNKSGESNECLDNLNDTEYSISNSGIYDCQHSDSAEKISNVNDDKSNGGRNVGEEERAIIDSSDGDTIDNNGAKPTEIDYPVAQRGSADYHRKSANNKSPKGRDLLTTSVVPGTTLDVVKISLGKNINLYDTPGLMVSHQLTNLLDEKDLRAVVPSKAVEKVSFRLTEGKALYIGGLARIELISGRSFFFTCFFSAKVTVHPGRADDAESFTERHIGGMLTPPSSKVGFERLGEWTSKAFTVEGDGWKRSSIDVVLSGLGWISITGPGNARVRIWVPRGVGVFTREPLMPFEVRGGVSSFTGSRAINRRQVNKRQRQRKTYNRADLF